MNLSLSRGSRMGWLGATALLAAIWVLPAVWYNPSVQKGQFVWLGEQIVVPDWKYTNIPIAKAAEAMLVGDRMVSGEFENDTRQTIVRVFSAKRYLEKENEVGLFSHTPDRCWTSGGWEIELVEPQFIDLNVHGVPMQFERRLFSAGANRELVYFGAVVGGRPLPYRLDQYLASSMKKTKSTQADGASVWLRLKDNRLWSWAWESFVNRTAFGGPQQFIRISTPVAGGDLAEADARLRDFLPLWLKPVEYDAEVAEWRKAPQKQTTASS